MKMTLATNNGVSHRELSVDELETIAAGFTLWSWFGSEPNSILSEQQLIMGSRYHPPLPSGGPGPKGGPYRV
jgi:hypothetical protein